MARRVIGYRFTVEGTGVFPFDMLRYDACHPYRQEDVAELAHGYRGYTPTDGRRKVRLASSGDRPPTTDRWLSFGWSVADVEVIR